MYVLAVLDYFSVSVFRVGTSRELFGVGASADFYVK